MTIYIMGIYLLIMSLLVNIMELNYFILILLLGLLGILVIKKESLEKPNKIFIIIASGFFLFRVLVGVNFTDYKVGERVELIVKPGIRSSLVTKIDGKLPRSRIYLEGQLEGRERYKVEGEIINKEQTNKMTVYKLDRLKVEKIEESISKSYLYGKIKSLLRGYSSGMKEFYKGVIIGEKDGLDREVKDKFSYTGTSHLIVISGLHIGVIIALMMYLVGKIPINHDMRYIGVIIMLSLYVLAVGFSASVVRAYVMGLCYLGGGFLYEESDGKKSLFTAMVINLLIDPLGAGSVSFQLSYVAVFTILFIYPYFERYLGKVENKPLKWVLGMGALSLVIQLALTPIFMMNFRSIPILSFLVNIIAIPIGVLFVQSAFMALILSVVGLGWVVMPTVNLLYLILVGFIDIAARVSLLSIEYRGATKSWYVIFFYLGLYIFLNKKRSLSLIPLVVLLLLNRERTTNYIGDGYTYYHKDPRVVVAEKKLTKWDIEDIWDNRIKKVEVLVGNGRQDEEIVESLEVEEVIILGKNERLDIINMEIKNIDKIEVQEK